MFALKLILPVLALANLSAASNDLTLFGYKPQVLLGKTTWLEVLGKDGPLQAVEITPADGLTVGRIREKAIEPGRSIRAGARLWEFELTVIPGAKTGERSVLLKTPAGPSEPGALVVVPYVPVIQGFRVLSATRSGAAVEVELVVVDEGGALGPDPEVNWELMCGGGGVFASTWLKKYEQKDPKTAILRTTLSQPGSHASGTCEFAVSVANHAGYRSEEKRTTVTFQ